MPYRLVDKIGYHKTFEPLNQEKDIYLVLH